LVKQPEHKTCDKFSHFVQCKSSLGTKHIASIAP
jgi:hypothetical protein